MANKIHEVESMQGKVKFKEINGKFYRIKKDGTVAKEATGRNSLLVQQILNKTKSKKSKPSYMESLHASYYTPKKPKSKKQLASNILDSVKKAKAAADAKKKSSNVKKGEAHAATLDGNKPTVVKKKEKKNNFGVDTFDKARVRNVKSLKTKKVPTVAEKKKEKPKTITPKPFDGTYNKKTQKLINIDGKTYEVPKSYKTPKRKLRKGGHVDYRKTGLFR